MVDAWIRNTLLVLVWLSFIKHFWGFHWRWETCECCGKKWGKHSPAERSKP